MPAGTPILEALALEHGYDGVPALRGLTLRLWPGRRVALLGANGAGKSTLLLHLNGTLRPARGEVRMDGRPCRHGRRALREWRRRVGMVFQDPEDQLFAATVAQDVSFGPLNLDLSPTAALRRVEDALAAVGIAELADRPTHQLSFGQRRRVALAGVLAMRPDVVLLDEPTAGLDPAAAEELLAVLERLRAGGATPVITTHDLDLALEWADEVAVLHEGRVLGAGAPEVVLGDEGLLRTARLRMPRVLELSRAVRRAGLLPAGAAPAHRSVGDLCRDLEAAWGRSGR